MKREIHPDFLYFLKYKDQELIDLYLDLREFILSILPESNEFLYHTHALTSVYSISAKLGDAFCMIPIYTKHLNLGFNKGTLINDPNNLLQGTGKLIRHIPINKKEDYKNSNVEKLVKLAVDFAINDLDKESKIVRTTISKIKC
jgi:hypothetical protein